MNNDSSDDETGNYFDTYEARSTATILQQTGNYL